MPVSRKKSCVPCRAAKARCNLERICNRCVDRGLRCSYSDARPGPYSQRQGGDASLGPEEPPPRNSGASPLLAEQSGAISVEQIMGVGLGGDPFDVIRNLTAAPVSNIPDWSEAFWNDGGTSTTGIQTGLWHNNEMSTLPAETANRQSQATMFDGLPVDVSADSGAQAHTVSNDSSQGRSAAPDNFDDERPRRVSLCPTSLPVKPSGRDITIYGMRITNILSPKTARTPQSFLMTRVLLSQVTSYPKMLTSGQLPPFLYPTCVLNKLDGSCARDDAHTCLPEPLAICKGLVGMFYGRTPQSTAFIWKTIVAEQNRLLEEVHTSDIISSFLFSVSLFHAHSFVSPR
jgi:hypothetical protein